MAHNHLECAYIRINWVTFAWVCAIEASTAVKLAVRCFPIHAGTHIHAYIFTPTQISILSPVCVWLRHITQIYKFAGIWFAQIDFYTCVMSKNHIYAFLISCLLSTKLLFEFTFIHTYICTYTYFAFLFFSVCISAIKFYDCKTSS